MNSHVLILERVVRFCLNSMGRIQYEFMHAVFYFYTRKPQKFICKYESNSLVSLLHYHIVVQRDVFKQLDEP